MSKPQSNRALLESAGGGRLRISGVLDSSTAGELLKESRAAFASTGNEIEVDLTGVSESDSAGLALLIEWVRIAKDAGRPIRFVNAPDQISALARISEVEDLLFGSASPSVAPSASNDRSAATA